MYLPSLWDFNGGNLGKELDMHAGEESNSALLDALESSAAYMTAKKAKADKAEL
jgi:hypothetical protein